MSLESTWHEQRAVAELVEADDFFACVSSCPLNFSHRYRTFPPHVQWKKSPFQDRYIKEQGSVREGEMDLLQR